MEAREWGRAERRVAWSAGASRALSFAVAGATAADLRSSLVSFVSCNSAGPCVTLFVALLLGAEILSRTPCWRKLLCFHSAKLSQEDMKLQPVPLIPVKQAILQSEAVTSVNGPDTPCRSRVCLFRAAGSVCRGGGLLSLTWLPCLGLFMPLVRV